MSRPHSCPATGVHTHGRSPLRTHRSVALSLATLVLLGTTACTGSDESDEQPTDGSSSAQAEAGDAGDAAAVALDEQVTVLIDRGIEQASAGDYTSASVTFDNALVLDPGNKFALFNLGLIAQVQSQRNQALKWYDAALESDPQYTPAMYNKAILLEKRDLAKSVELYEQILTIDDQASTTYFRLSFAYAELGQDDLAEEMRARAIELDPTLADVDTLPPG